MSENFSKKYWEEKYVTNQTGWDVGTISTPLKEYIDQLTDKNLKILVPGAGNGYEAQYLFENGFKNVTIIDIAIQPLTNFLKANQKFPKENVIQIDFFDHNQKYDLILEQTFFCALHPSKRHIYVNKMYDLLEGNGKLVGLFFDFDLTNEGPPFGGSLIEYVQLFNAKFELLKFEKCFNSIKPRNGNELFLIAKRN